MYVNGAVANSGGSSETSQGVTYSPTPGNIVVIALAFAAAISGAMCQDNNGNFLTLGSSQGFLQMFYGVAKVGATSYTASWTGSTAAAMAVVEYTGEVGNGNNVSQNQGVGSSGDPPAFLNTTTYMASSIIVSAFSAQMVTSTWFQQNPLSGPSAGLQLPGTIRQNTGSGAGPVPCIVIIDNASSSVGNVVTIQTQMVPASDTNYYAGEAEVYSSLLPPFVQAVQADDQWLGGEEY